MVLDSRRQKILKALIDESKKRPIDFQYIWQFCKSKDEYHFFVEKLTKVGLIYFDDLNASEVERKYSLAKAKDRLRAGQITKEAFENEVGALVKDNRVFFNKSLFAPSNNSDQEGPIKAIDYAAPYQKMFEAFMDQNHGYFVKVGNDDFVVIDCQHDLETLH